MNKLQTIFSAGDYQRYHSGQMSAAEMNALEKAAMADPFIQDSLDGYAQLPHAKDDILRLKERLKTIIEKKEKKSLAWLWRVAAILIFGAGIGLLVYKNAGDKAVPEIASIDVKQRENLNDNTSIQSQTSDSVTASNKDLASVPSADGTAGKNNIAVKSPEKIANISTMKDQSRELLQTDNNILQGKVVDEKGAAVKNAIITTNEKKLLTQSRDDGSFSVTTKEEAVSVEVASVGYNTKKEVLNTNQSANVVLTKKSKSTISPNNSVTPATEPVDNNVPALNIAQPYDGWENFTQYLKENRPVLYKADGTKLSGRVQLAFKISAEGHPTDIMVKYSNISQANAASIDLLKNGPTWVGAVGKFHEITIEY